MKTVILCGGSGTRLWPVSRKTAPKQFAKIFDDKSLFEMTLERNRELTDGFLIVANQAQMPLCKEQTGPDKAVFFAESVGKNTAPAIAFAALSCDPQETLLVLPSDHLIKNLDIYNDCVAKAKSFAEEGNLVTFGIKAAYPETGYGYIEARGNDVLSFKEKPDIELAKRYVEQGDYYWNSGMFCFKAGVFLEELATHSPELEKACREAFANIQKDGQTCLLAEDLMAKVPSDSIDYAVMEKSSKVKVVPSNFYWSDLGSFDSLYDVFDKDGNGNSSNPNFYQLDSKNNLVMGGGKKVIAAFDVEDLLIVDTEDALLIGKRGNAQKVKELLKKVTERRPDLAE